MVFLFPGVLFRRFYFSGKYSKQFNQGNLLERFLWTLFFSSISLTICGIIFYTINTKLELNLLHNVTFENISNIFKCLAANEYPDEFSNGENLTELGILLLIIYTFSAASGYFCLWFVRVFNLDYTLSVLKFNNEWLYLSEANKDNGVRRKKGDVHYTQIDVLTYQKDKEELYRGVYKDFFFDKDNKLESVVLTNAQKFLSFSKTEDNVHRIQSLHNLIQNKTNTYSVHKDFDDKIVFKKNIDGHVLVLPINNLGNINFTYVKISNRFSKLKFYFSRIAFLILIIFYICLFIFPFLNIEIDFFNTVWKRSLFSVSTGIVLLFVLNTPSNMLEAKNKYKVFIENLLFILWWSIPYLYIFNLVSGTITTTIFILMFLITGGYAERNKKIEP